MVLVINLTQTLLQKQIKEFLVFHLVRAIFHREEIMIKLHYINPITLLMLLLLVIVIYSIFAKIFFKRKLFSEIISCFFIFVFAFIALFLYYNFLNPLFVDYSYKARTSEATTILELLSREKNEWSIENFENYLGAQNMTPTHYTIYLDSGRILSPTYNIKTKLPSQYVPYYISKENFLIFAVQNLDSDDALDIWAIDEYGNLLHVCDDL